MAQSWAQPAKPPKREVAEHADALCHDSRSNPSLDRKPSQEGESKVQEIYLIDIYIRMGWEDGSVYLEKSEIIRGWTRSPLKIFSNPNYSMNLRLGRFEPHVQKKS